MWVAVPQVGTRPFLQSDVAIFINNSIINTMNTSLLDKRVIARIERAGVFHGTLDYIDNEIIRLKDARRIYYWNGALSVTDMAAKGITGGKVTIPVTTVEFMSDKIIELNECSEDASKSIETIKPWKN